MTVVPYGGGLIERDVAIQSLQILQIFTEENHQSRFEGYGQNEMQ